MSNRVYNFNQHRTATRHLLGWFGVAAASTVLAATMAIGSAHAAGPAPQGLMLRPGLWDQGHGSYVLPAALASQPGQWPVDGWFRVIHKGDHLHVQAVKTPARGLPDFLHDVAVQLSDPASDAAIDEAESVDTRYLRVPAARLAEGRKSAVPFARGQLTPRLDHAYALKLGDTDFTLKVQNGLRSKAGVAYGEGALYQVSYAGQTYSYLLPGSGWDSTVHAVADLDADGHPDFIVRVADTEFLLLSGRARPGRNQPTAVLSRFGGC